MKWKALLFMISAGVVATMVLACSDDDDFDMMDSPGAGMNDSMGGMDSGYAGMMRAMGAMDSDEMLAEMQEVLGSDDYQAMLDHIAEHRSGDNIEHDPEIDRIMHELMDGMLMRMPADEDGIMPMTPR